MCRPLIVINRQQCVKGRWRTSTILILVKDTSASEITFISHNTALKRIMQKNIS